MREALTRIGQAQLFIIDGPVDLDIRLPNRFMAEWLAYLGEVERFDAFTIRYRAEDIVAVSRFLIFQTFARNAIG